MDAKRAQRRLHVKWLAAGLIALSVIIVLLLLFSQHPLVVKGVLRTQNGPLAAGTYDFRIKFYQATTRTDLVYSYDAADIVVDKEGNFTAAVPNGRELRVATLMQVCIASNTGAISGTVSGGKAKLSSCNVPHEATAHVFNQTICGLTAVDQNPTSAFNWLAAKNIIYATPTKTCGHPGRVAATVSDTDVVGPLLKGSGTLADVFDGIAIQPGSLLTGNEAGQIVMLPPSQVINKTIQEEIAKDRAENPPQNSSVTNVFNTFPTTVKNQPNTDNQTLALNGSTLTISGGNSVVLPSGDGASEQDGVIGNEIMDISGSGLVRVGAGTTLDPFRVGLITCANGEIIKTTGAGAWGCAADTDTTYTAGTGISFSGTAINNTGVLSLSLPAGGGLANMGTSQAVALTLQDCGNGEILQYNAGSWGCVAPGSASPYSFAITDTTTTEPVLNGDTITFVGNEGLAATVTATDNVTYGILNSGVTTVKLADGAIVTSKIADGAVTTIKLGDGSISTNKLQDNAVTGQKIAAGTVANNNLANSSLVITAGTGLSGGGVVALGSSTTLNLQTCANGQILKHNGTTWVCAADSGDTNTDAQTLTIAASAPSGANTVSYTLSISGGNSINFDDRDTLYTSVASGGLALNGTAFSLQSCPVGQILKSTNAGTSAYTCATDTDTDTNTTYTAGTGLSLVGTTFNNMGVLSVAGAGPIASTGGQNPTIAFANGATAGQFWQWDGDSWELASLAAESDSVIGNEVTNATGSNSGLVRSGSGTAVDPYTLAASAGNGLQIASNTIRINSPTCSGTDKLQWTGTAFVCSADVDTDTNTTYTAGNGVSLTGTTFSINSPTCAGTTKLQWTGTAFACSADIDTNTDAQTLSFDNGTRLLAISGGNSVVIPDANTTYSALASSGLRLVGTEFGLAVCTSGQILKAQATSGQYACAADNDTDTNTTYSAGTGLSLVGTTFNNTGVLSVTGSGAITSSGGQNPNIAFANGSATGQFWQWDGDSWELATLAAESDSVIGNEVTNVTGTNSGLTRSGSGTAIDPYTLAANAGSGLQIASNLIQISSPTCSGTDKLQWTGTAFVCSTDVDTDTNTTYTAGNGIALAGTSFSVNSPTCASTTKLQWTGTAFVCSADVDTDTNTDAQTLSFDNGTRLLTISGGNNVTIPDANTTYAALANGGLRLVGTEFGLAVCTAGQVLKAQATSGEYACAADTDTNTTYTAGTGLSLVGTTFNNTGVLSVTGSGAITSSGGQNPNIAFANGSTTGQFWQWDGDSWELATLAAEQDAVIGNEVTNVTGANSGLVRSGTGTAVDPYTLAVNAGNGLQLSGGNVAINSPTCTSTDKLQWTGTAFVCSADVDTDTNTTYTADGLGIELSGTTFGLELNGTTLSKSASGLALNLSNANIWTALQTFGAGLTVTTGQNLTVNGDAFTNLTGTGLTVAGGALQTTLGTTIDLTTEVVNVLPVANGGTGLNATGTANQLLGVNAAGTALEYKNLSTLLVAGSGISFSGTNTVTISNTGASSACDVSSNYACNGGNTLAAALTLGTNDAQSLIFETNNATRMTILSGGNVGIGISPTEKLDVNGNINIPITSSTAGIIKQNGASWIHSMGTGNFFAGSTSGNFTLTGTNNIGIGSATLQSLTSGSSNVAIGGSSLPLATTGSQNTSIGSNTLQSNTTGQLNTALGFQALNTNVSGTHNTASGVNALTSNATGSLNTATGYGALQSNLGSNNTAFGTQSLSGTTSGTFNTAVGSQSGQTGTAANINTTGSYNTFLGYSTGLSSVTQRNYSTAIGAFATVNQGDSLVLGCIATINSCPVTTKIGIANTSPSFLLHVGSSSIASGTAVARFENAGGTCTVTPNTAGGISCTSDKRLKKNIENFSGALNLVNKIDVKQFNMLTDKDTSKKQIGVIAQQLETVLPGLVMTDEKGYKSVSYAALTPVVLQAIKEQQVEMKHLKQGLWTGGIVSKDATFKAAATFEGPIHFIGDATFTGNVTITGNIKLSHDQANQATLPARKRRVLIVFDGRYAKEPYVTVTPREFVTGSFRVTDVKTTGFVVEVQQAQPKDVHFDWHAFANK